MRDFSHINIAGSKIVMDFYHPIWNYKINVKFNIFPSCIIQLCVQFPYSVIYYSKISFINCRNLVTIFLTV